MATFSRRTFAIPFATVVAGCVGVSAPPSAITDPPIDLHSAADPVDAIEEPIIPTGFQRQSALLTFADGSECELCVWVADDDRLRHQGLMGVTDLGDADAMAFAYPDPKRRSFWMKDTILDLTILFVGVDGTVGEVRRMTPCAQDPCPTYESAEPFTVAVEFAAADRARFDLDQAERFALLDRPCP